MKRNLPLFAALLLIVCLFVGCAEDHAEPVTISCRIIAVMDRELLLAADGYPPIMALSPAANPKITVLRDGIAATDGDMPIPGDRVLLTFSDGITETSPALPRGVTQMEIVTAEFDNLASVYLDVLTDLSKEDGDNLAAHAMLAVSLEETALPAWEQTAVVYAIAKQYPTVSVIEESRADLMAKGFMTKEPDSPRWHWEDGAFLTLSENTRKCTDHNKVFNANYNSGFSRGWTNCKTVRDADSDIWSPYDIGGKVMS